MQKKLSSPEILILLAGFTALVAVQLFFKYPPLYDESDYLGNVAVLHQYGFSKNFLVHLAGSAGPLYPVIHYLFEPLTGLTTPHIRLVNTIFLAGVIYFTYQTFSLFENVPKFFALYIMAAPMIYVIAGLALTEMPAMFFLGTAVYLVIKSMGASTTNPVPMVVLAGTCMSLAILGRQPYLLTLAAFPVLFASQRNVQKNALLLFIFLFFSVLLPAYIFYTWKGMVPPIESTLYTSIADAGSSLRPDFFFLCVFYFATVMWLVAPHFFRPSYSRKTIIIMAACLLVLFGANIIFNWIEWIPLKSGLEIFTTRLQTHLVAQFFGSIAIVISFYFLACAYNQFQNKYYTKEGVFFITALLLVALACTKITWGFSSRYAGQGIPLLILLGGFFYRESKYSVLRILLGVTIGLISVVSYFIKL